MLTLRMFSPIFWTLGDKSSVPLMMAMEFNEDKLEVTNICVSIEITQEYILLGFPCPVLHFFLTVIDYSENTKKCLHYISELKFVYLTNPVIRPSKCPKLYTSRILDEQKLHKKLCKYWIIKKATKWLIKSNKLKQYSF